MTISNRAPRPRTSIAVLALSAVLSLVACSQKDPNDDGNGSPAGGNGGSGGTGGSDAGMPGEDAGSQPGNPDADYYPLADGASWTYRHIGGATEWDEVVEQTATEYTGEPAVLLIDNPSPSGNHSETILKAAGTRVSRVYRDEYTGTVLQLSAEYDPGFLRYDRAWEDRAEGHSEVSIYQRTEYDALGQIAAMAERSHRFTVEALADSVSVPAGDFENCLRIRRSRVRAAGTPAAEGDEDLFWFCPGIGKTREVDQTTGQSEELVACEVPEGACP